MKIARIAEAAGRKRCDWEIRVGDVLVLVDAKRLGVTSEWIMGLDVNTRLRERIDKEGGEVCDQFLQTIEDIERVGVNALIPEFPPGWKPARVHAWVVHHRPLFMWFNSSTKLLERTVGVDRWRKSFSARPAFLSISELELLEGALPTLNIDRYLRAREREDPTTYLALDHYLYETGWRGPYASPYYVTRSRELLETRAYNGSDKAPASGATRLVDS
jgi:hypothetical protein